MADPILPGATFASRRLCGQKSKRLRLPRHYCWKNIEFVFVVIDNLMTPTSTSPILQLIRRSAHDQRDKLLTDQELLRRFRSERDEAAFHTLLRRHGSMVLDVCRNVLGNEADAEDAFQATFLILAQKARSIRKEASVGSWLYGVAFRTALKARANSAKRQQHETRGRSQLSSGASDDLSWREVQQVLHEELNKIAACYRAPLVLCYMEGNSQAEAAAALGVSAATVNKRLEQGRARLRTRLVRRGLGGAAVSMTAAWPLAASGQPTPLLVAGTVRAAQLLADGKTASEVVSVTVAALTQGMLKGMLMHKLKVITAAVLMVAALCGTAGLICRTLAGESELLASVADTPQAVVAAAPSEFQRLESRCVALVPKLQPAVVGVLSPSKAARPRQRKHAGGGSGVIITADGLVLSQMHVSHMRDGVNDFTKPHHMPGELATVFLADGRECKAKLLGASLEYDLSLLQLSEPGPYPFVPLQADATVRPGDWMVKLGHPGGFRKDRPAPMRLGRVLGSTPDAFVTDCPITRGDSGGPFFDLDGRLVGILDQSDAGVATRFNGIPEVGVIDWDVVQDIWTACASPRIAMLVESMKKGDILPGHRTAQTALAGAKPLAADQWTQGKKTKGIFEPVTRPLATSVVTILNRGVPIGLGTVVDKDGLAVVMASVLPPQPQCRLPDGSIADVTVVGVDRPFDLAVIRIPAKSIRPILWADRDSLPAGTIVAAVGSGGFPLKVGVVSVATRKLADAKAPAYDLPLRVKVDTSWVYVEPSKNGSGYTILMAYGLAKSVGIRPGDRLVSIAGQPVASDDDIAKSIADKRSGDVASVGLIREGKAMTLELPLLPQVSINAQNATWRSDDYPIALEYSPPVRTTECGGPLVDVSGRVVGVTVGRMNTHAGWAIPIESVRKIVADAKIMKLSPWPVR